MVNVSEWMELFLKALDVTFSERVRFVGLQGSYGRGEATEKSDIDVVVILDELTASDIEKYNAMLDTLPARERICGFLSGNDELLSWEPSELFQFYYDTRPIRGSICELLSLIDSQAIDRAIKIGACNIYHGCVHNMLHEKSEEILFGLYKTASFVVQAIVFKQTGRYVGSQKELLEIASETEKEIVKTFVSLKNGVSVDFKKASESLFIWAKKQIAD